MRIYTVSSEPPTKKIDKSWVRIPYDIQEEPPRADGMVPPEGMKEYSYLEQKLTHAQYQAITATTDDVDESAAEVLVAVYELYLGSE